MAKIMGDLANQILGILGTLGTYSALTQLTRGRHGPNMGAESYGSSR